MENLELASYVYSTLDKVEAGTQAVTRQVIFEHIEGSLREMVVKMNDPATGIDPTTADIPPMGVIAGVGKMMFITLGNMFGSNADKDAYADTVRKAIEQNDKIMWAGTVAASFITKIEPGGTPERLEVIMFYSEERDGTGDLRYYPVDRTNGYALGEAVVMAPEAVGGTFTNLFPSKKTVH